MLNERPKEDSREADGRRRSAGAGPQAPPDVAPREPSSSPAAPIFSYLAGRRGRDGVLVRARLSIATLCSSGLAAVAAGYASSYVVGGLWPVVIGFAWGLMIANADTMIMAVVGDRAGAARWIALAPRIPVVILSALIFAELLMLRLFQPEVEEQLSRSGQTLAAAERGEIESRYDASTQANKTRFAADVTGQEKAVAALEGQLADADARRREAGQAALVAAKERRFLVNQDGTYYVDSTHSRAAQGEEQRIAAERDRLRDQLKPRVDQKQADIARLRVDEGTEQARIDDRRKEELAKLDARPTATGLLARTMAFEDICSANASARWARRLLGLLLMLVELLPTFAKFGERGDAALIRERLHELLREVLQSVRIKEYLALWMEMSTCRYVEPYMAEIDREIGHGRPAPDDSSAVAPHSDDDASPVRDVDRAVRQGAARAVDDADARVRRLIRLRTQEQAHTS